MATNALAERLGVTPASVSAMVKKLDERGLVRHVRYKGVALTPDGERVALEVMRHHRLLETYLAEHLGVPWDRVHEEAEALEHVLSEYLEARIAAKLGHPTHDPHGDPIPTVALEIEESDTLPAVGARGGRPRALRARVGLRSGDAALPGRARRRAGRRARGARAPAVRRPADGPLRRPAARARRHAGARDARRAHFHGLAVLHIGYPWGYSYCHSGRYP